MLFVAITFHPFSFRMELFLAHGPRRIFSPRPKSLEDYNILYPVISYLENKDHTTGPMYGGGRLHGRISYYTIFSALWPAEILKRIHKRKGMLNSTIKIVTYFLTTNTF